MTTESDETHKLIHVALEVLKLGDRDTAQQLAQQAAALSPGLEAPWLILAALASPEESLKYIHKALQINPHSRQAQAALNWALKRQPPLGSLSQEIKSEQELLRKEIARKLPLEPEPLRIPIPGAIELEPEPPQAELASSIPSKPQPDREETAQEIPTELETPREEIPHETPPEPQFPQAEIAAVIPAEPESAWDVPTQELAPGPQSPQAGIAAVIPPEPESAWEATTQEIPSELETYWDKPAEDIPLEPESSQGALAQPIAPVTEPLREPILHALAPEPTQEPNSRIIEPEQSQLREEIVQAVLPQEEPARRQSAPPGRPAGATAFQKSTAQSSIPARETKKSSLSTGRFALITFIGLVVIVLVAGFFYYRPQITGQLARLLNPIPTPQCIQPLLKIGSVQFPIKSIARAADGSLPILNKSDVAWWVEGTTVNYVFEVNPTSAGAAALASIQIDDNLTIAWADCTTDEYVANTIATEAPVDSSMFDQTHGGISIFIPGSATTAHLLIRGVRP